MGYGVIVTSEELLRYMLNAPEGAKLEETPLDSIADVLKLPDSYKVIGIAQQFYRRVYLIGVESPELPETPIGMDAPIVTPTYQRDLIEQPDGTMRAVVSIQSISVWTPPNRDQWPVVQ